MEPIEGYDRMEARHGGFERLEAGGYVMFVIKAYEDVTGYGNRCLKVAYDIAEGPQTGRFADVANDPEQDWQHEFEVDVEEARGARLKALTDAVMASNPGYVWDWDEAGLAGKYVGVVLRERLVTAKRGKRKGQDMRYLDFWDAVPVDAIRAGDYSVPPTLDKRDPKTQRQATTPAPQPAPQAAPAVQAAPAPMPQPMQAQAAPQAAPAPQPAQPQWYQQATQPTPAPQPQAYAPQPAQQQMPMPQQPVDVYDGDIPF